MSTFDCHICKKRLERVGYMLGCYPCGIYYSIFPYDPLVYNSQYLLEYETRYLSDLGVEIREARKEKMQWKLNHHFAGQSVNVFDVGCGVASCLEGLTEIKSLSKYDPLFRWKNNHFMPSDVVVFFDSFEHFENPWKLVSLMDPYMVYITMPVLPEDYRAGYKPLLDWKHYKPREHLILFSTDGIKKYMDHLGYAVYTIEENERVFGREDIYSFTFLRRVSKFKN